MKFLLALLAFIALASAWLSGPAGFGRAAGTVSFVRGTVTGSGFTTVNPTSIAFGPDGRLYVADLKGRIQALDLDPISKQVTAVQEVASNADLQDVIGIAFDPTETSSPSPIYVTNTLSVVVAPGSYPGKITKIHGAGYGNKTDIITGLPAGQGHQSNGLAFADDGTLYIAQGGTTNAGVPGESFGRPETPLSSAILVANLSTPGFDGNITYDPPNTYDTSVDQVSGDVSVYAHGLRNQYDLVIHSNGRIYATDNAPDSGEGEASTACDSQVEDPWGIEHPPDELNLINQGEYYGHPNRNRGRFDPRQCVYHSGTEGDGPDWTGPLALLPASSNGLVEYTAGTFGGQLQGNLFYVGFVDGVVGRIVLSQDGTAVTSHTVLDSGYGSWNLLDITMGEDGTLYLAEFNRGRITFLKPDESSFIPGVLNTNAAVDGGEDDLVDVTTDGAGNWVAIWRSNDALGNTIGSDYDILVARSTDNGATWTAPVSLDTDAGGDGGDDRRPQVTTDGAGNWIAAWGSREDLSGTIGSDFDILVARSTDSGTTWTAPVALNTNAATDIFDDRRVEVTTDDAGNWVAIWGSRDTPDFTSGANMDIRTARSTDNGATWTAATILHTRFTEAIHDEFDHAHPQLTTDGVGNWLAIWESRDFLSGIFDSPFDIRVALSTNNGATWTAPFVYIDTSQGGGYVQPDLATDGAGNWLTAWESPDSLNGTIGTDSDILYRTDILDRTDILYVADTDGDGCSDQRENGPDETRGGQRDYKNPWDFYDVVGGGGSAPDGVIDLPNDILGVIQHFSPQGQPPYDVQFDRGPQTGANVWNMSAPDGVIDLPNDILGVIQQFGHTCV